MCIRDRSGSSLECRTMALFLAAAAAFLSACALQGQPSGNDAKGAEAQPTKQLGALKTAAERSDYHATASYDDVNAYLKDLAGTSTLVRISDIGSSGEGRK